MLRILLEMNGAVVAWSDKKEIQMIQSVASRVRKLAEDMELESFMKRVGEGKAFFSQRCKLASPLPVKRLTIEIEGIGKSAMTSRTRIFADGKQLPLIRSFSLDTRCDSAVANIKLTQSTVVMNEKKIEAKNNYDSVKAVGKNHVIEMVPQVIERPIEIQWLHDYDDIGTRWKLSQLKITEDDVKNSVKK